RPQRRLNLSLTAAEVYGPSRRAQPTGKAPTPSERQNCSTPGLVRIIALLSHGRGFTASPYQMPMHEPDALAPADDNAVMRRDAAGARPPLPAVAATGWRNGNKTVTTL